MQIWYVEYIQIYSFLLTIKFALEEMRAQFLKGGINAKLKELEDHRMFLLFPSNWYS